MQFTRLRLSGFKSFVDPTELYIEPGMTGIVGPNGCGKSNLIEALRWVMGESSPKSMRGGGMEDVIFAGNFNRPQRNFADVTLLIDNTSRTAPAAYNESEQIEVSRRIERDAGSAYRVNGREARQRDVQLLFADAATGPHSPAMVSQGRVGMLINAKPRDRRAILEEAAGISGLHSRRHEAELRLRAAENNLVRLHDVMTQIEGQLGSLKRQAKQASRYKNLSARIRETEALLLHLRWIGAGEALHQAEQQLSAIDTQVSERTAQAAKASTAQADVAATLPRLRDDEARAAAGLHRLAAARDSLDAEERRARETTNQLRARLVQIANDTEREQTLVADAQEVIDRLDRERRQLEALGGQGEARGEAEQKVRQAQEAAVAAESKLDKLNQEAAAAVARRASLSREIEQTELRRQRLRGEAERTQRQIGELEREQATDDRTRMDAEIEAARLRVDESQKAMVDADQERLAATEREAKDRAALNEAEAAVTRLNAEASALADLLDANSNEDYPPATDSITVEAGYEAAIGAALGDDLSVPVAPEAPVHWANVAGPALQQALPDNAEPLSLRVKAPEALARRLSQIGVIEAENGEKLRDRLLPGQRLVTRDGALWRWDGYTAAAGAMNTAAARLEQRNRLERLRSEISDSEAQRDKVRARFEAACIETRAAADRENAARRAWRETEQRLSALREQRLKSDKDASQRASRLAAAQETAARLARDIEETEQRAVDSRQRLANLPTEDTQRAAIVELRTDVEGLRTALAQARGAYDSLEREVKTRLQRLDAIAAERQAWDLRVSNARRQKDRLAERLAEAREELRKVEGRPAEIEQQRLGLVEKIAAAEAERQGAADRLAQAETQLAERDRELKAAQEALAEAREQRVRIEALRDQARERRQAIEERIAEELECEPPQAAMAAGLSGDGAFDLPDVETTAASLERYKRERDRMGPVNLRAETEATELDEQLNVMRTERCDLEAAIGRLRQAIASLNREGRERLLAAFTEVDRHFQELFRELFGGGKAHLALTESDDPLDAGLEIMASPPGKTLQILSLLSGGEQALTALALIFAVFLTNPAPVCVLDEVDAPLDDANVGRFCRLMQRITTTTETRFLIVTHHPLTMSHVDRLFGVTMSEPGISQLVSLDLGEAEQLQAAG
ncbi:MAG: chromosome segregation protein SMC [Sphingomonadales bacterium]